MNPGTATTGGEAEALADRFAAAPVVKRTEGGRVLSAEDGDAFLVIIDERALAELVGDAVVGETLVRVLSFGSEQDRLDFLNERFPGHSSG